VHTEVDHLDPRDFTRVWQAYPHRSPQWRAVYAAARNAIERNHSQSKAGYGVALAVPDRRGLRGALAADAVGLARWLIDDANRLRDGSARGGRNAARQRDVDGDVRLTVMALGWLEDGTEQSVRAAMASCAPKPLGRASSPH
jgi:hypothetical protein